ncbi:MAG: fused MFS/spermidine synthase [Myxococcota bacterium]|nr:fused MFS/spermidine synthase [Myxococcota bacterium]
MTSSPLRNSYYIIIILLFILSGMAGLIYELVWTRMLVLVFGNTMYATSTVLSAFMAGLAMGSVTIGRYIDQRPRNLIRLYGLLEVFIGGFALLFPFILNLASPLYAAVYRAVDGSLFVVNTARFVLCFALILIPSFFMGGTLPTIVKYVVGNAPQTLGRRAGLFYSLNTFGGVLGCLITGFALLGQLGLAGSTYVAVGLNAAVAGIALLLGRLDLRPSPAAEVKGHSKRATSKPRAASKQTVSAPYIAYPRGIRIAVIVAIGLSGCSALALEVLWTRMLALFTSSTVHSFAAILSVFLGGIALGSLIYSQVLSRIQRQDVLFVIVQLALGLAAFLTPYVAVLYYPLFADTSPLLAFLQAAAFMIVPTLLFGVAFPAAVHIHQSAKGDVGQGIGRVFAANTVGTIVGAVAAGFVLIPLLGVHKGISLCSAFNVIAAASVFAAIGSQRRPGLSRGIAGIIAVAAASSALLVPDVFHSLYQKRQPNADILHYEEGQVATVVVYDFPTQGYKDLYLNAVEEASSRIWHVQLFKLLGMLPPLLHEDPKDAVMIAFGAGMSSGAAAAMVDTLDCVELNPDIRGVANQFSKENLDVINRRNFKLHTNDGRNFLYLTDKRYDIIMSDATNPRAFDSWTLYTAEFYQTAKRRLKPGGIFSQWIPMPLSKDAVKIVLNTFKSVFPHTSFWCIHGSSQCLMLGTPKRLNIHYDTFEERALASLKKVGFDHYGVDTVEKLLSFFFFGEDDLDQYLAGFDKINTDDLPIVQFYDHLKEAGITASLEMIPLQESILKYLSIAPEKKEGLGHVLRDYLAIGQYLNIGFLKKNDRLAFIKARARLAASPALVDDQNVKSAFNSDIERERYFNFVLGSDKYKRTDKDRVVALHALGYLYAENDQPQKAVRMLEQAVREKPDFARAHADLIRAHLLMHDEDAAVRAIARLRKLPPSWSIQFKLKDYLQVAYLQRMIRYEPMNAGLLMTLARSYITMGQIKRAVDLLNRATDAASGDPKLLGTVAQNFEFLGLRDRAADVLKQLSAIGPPSPTLQLQIAELQKDPFNLEIGTNQALNPERDVSDSPAAQLCKEARKMWDSHDPLGTITTETLAQVALKLEAAIGIDPQYMPAYQDISTVYEALEAYGRAADFLEMGLKQRPGFEMAERQVKRLRLLKKRKAALKDGRETALLNAEIAGLYWSIGEIELAKESLDQVIAAEKMNAFLWEKYGLILRKTGQLKAALSAFSRAVQMGPRLEKSRTNMEQIRTIVGP